jgi:hypothetical protein
MRRKGNGWLRACMGVGTAPVGNSNLFRVSFKGVIETNRQQAVMIPAMLGQRPLLVNHRNVQARWSYSPGAVYITTASYRKSSPSL